MKYDINVQCVNGWLATGVKMSVLVYTVYSIYCINRHSLVSMLK